MSSKTEQVNGGGDAPVLTDVEKKNDANDASDSEMHIEPAGERRVEKGRKCKEREAEPRNIITGMGLSGDGYGGLKQIISKPTAVPEEDKVECSNVPTAAGEIDVANNNNDEQQNEEDVNVGIIKEPVEQAAISEKPKDDDVEEAVAIQKDTIAVDNETNEKVSVTSIKEMTKNHQNVTVADEIQSRLQRSIAARNPITGSGLAGDGYGDDGLKPIITKQRQNDLNQRLSKILKQEKEKQLKQIETAFAKKQAILLNKSTKGCESDGIGKLNEPHADIKAAVSADKSKDSEQTTEKFQAKDVASIQCDEATDMASRNPITGMGLAGDGAFRPQNRRARREGNPLTGQGYDDMDTSNPALMLAHARKGRLPPGGYSSGLW